MKWPCVLIFVQLAISHATACSTVNFSSTYDAYPECASPCLACEDASYSSNFANNCDYASGDCCKSKYHSIIAETWSCVRTNCGESVSDAAFDTFVQFCKAMHQPLAESDVPSGYNTSTSESDDSKDGSNSAALTKGQIIGIASGCATGVGALVGLVSLLYKFWRHQKKKSLPNSVGNQGLMQT